MAARNKSKLSDEFMIVLSDEQTTSESEDENFAGEERNQVPTDRQSNTAIERPGNAQYLETPSVIQPIDFRNFSSDSLFGKRREVYRLKAQKLDGLVDCQFCKLIFDYTKTCNHFTMETDLKEE